MTRAKEVAVEHRPHADKGPFPKGNDCENTGCETVLTRPVTPSREAELIMIHRATTKTSREKSRSRTMASHIIKHLKENNTNTQIPTKYMRSEFW